MNSFARLTLLALLVGAALPRAAGPAPQFPRYALTPADAAFLNDLERATFRYFQDESSPGSGLTRDRSTKDSPASIAAVGFSLTAYGAAVNRRLIPRPTAAAYTRRVLSFLWTAPQSDQAAGVAGSHGFFYHFLSMERGERAWKCELSTIDTALLMAGVLFAREFYDRPDATEREIRTLADRLYRRVDWAWSTGGESPLVRMAWHPEGGFSPEDWRGYNEAMIVYLLGLGSPTRPLPDVAWREWTATYHQSHLPGPPYIAFGPLFGHQYSHIWVDFRGLRAPELAPLGIDYFENSRRATLAQWAYAIANPHHWRGYDALDWGLTACDGPADRTITLNGEPRQFFAYSERGDEDTRDDGTLAPTAAGGSLPFAPEVALPTLKHYRRDRPELWGRFGFYDAFNPTFPAPGGRGWVDTDTLGIDEGPILLMAENLRTGFVWNTMKKSPYLRQGLRRAGFTGGWLERAAPTRPGASTAQDDNMRTRVRPGTSTPCASLTSTASPASAATWLWGRCSTRAPISRRS